MAIHHKSSYPRILSKIVAHWKEVDASLPRGSSLVLKTDHGESLSLPDLVDLLLSIRVHLSAAQQRVGTATEARLIVDSAKRAILFRAQAIARNINWKNNHGTEDQINYPKINDDCEAFISNLEEMAGAWSAVDRLEGVPMVLAGRYRHSDFVSELGNLVESIAIAKEAAAAEENARAKYDALFKKLPDLLGTYHRAVLSHLPENSPLLKALPVTAIPDDSVPPPTDCCGTWSDSENSAVITWHPSPETRPHHHEVRYSPGAEYDAEIESTLAVIPMGQPSSWKGTGSSDSGSYLSLFRIYTVLKSGAESHGGTIAIVRSSGDD